MEKASPVEEDQVIVHCAWDFDKFENPSEQFYLVKNDSLLTVPFLKPSFTK